MAFAPDGRMFVWQKNGVVRIVKNGQLLPTPFIDLSAKVNTFDDRGIWGLAFDPAVHHQRPRLPDLPSTRTPATRTAAHLGPHG